MRGSGTPVADISGELGVSEATFYICKQKFRALQSEQDPAHAVAQGGKHPPEHFFADLTLDKHMRAYALRSKPAADTAPRAGPVVSIHERRHRGARVVVLARYGN